MSKGWKTLLVTLSFCQLQAQVEKTPCGYVTDPAFIKLRLDAGSNFTRRLDFYKKSPKAERAIWEGIRIEKGRFVPVPRSNAGLFPSSIIQKKDMTALFQAMDRLKPALLRVPVVAHIVRRSNGTGGLLEADLRASIERANIHFRVSGMKLELCAVRFIDSDGIFDTPFDDIFSGDPARNSYTVLDVRNRNAAGKLNIYCVPNAPTSWAWRPTTHADFQHILFLNEHIRNESTFSHEVGHWFGLLHTHGGSGNELVNGSNCATQGDLVCDTPADPNQSGRVDASCRYTGTETDRLGATYTPDPTNLLSYAPKTCRTRFSPDQTDIMQSVYLGMADERGYSFRSCANPSCTKLRMESMQLVRDGSLWRIRISGTSRDLPDLNIPISLPFDTEIDAREAVQALRARVGLDLCVLSGTNLYYFLLEGSPIEYPSTRNTVSLEPSALSVQPLQDGRFQIGNLGNRSPFFVFDSREDAEQGLSTLRRYRFRKAYIAEPGTVILSR
jgi:hypothetical protein